MLSDAQRTLLETKGAVIGRVLLGLMFFYSGIGMLLGEGGVSGFGFMLTEMGVPLAAVAAWLVVALKLIAGGALMAGYKVEEAAGALIVFTLIATYMVHLSPDDPALGKNLAIVGGLLLAAGHASAKRNVANANAAM